MEAELSSFLGIVFPLPLAAAAARKRKTKGKRASQAVFPP